MAQSGYTPVSLYYSSTSGVAPTAGNLVAGELALNTTDGKLYFKNTSGAVTLLASASGAAAAGNLSGGTSGQIPYQSAPNTTVFMPAPGTSGTFLEYNGSGFIWSGAVGTSGYSGYSGFSGISGANGASGFSGFSGISGANGTSGFSGYSGAAGSGGTSGVSGYSGYSGSGISGYSGYSGSGISGYSGFSGINGTNGLSGFSGASGISGFSGFSGYSGSTAYTATNLSGGYVSATSIAYSTTLTGGTGIVNLGSGQFYKDASGNVSIGYAGGVAPLYVKGGNSNNLLVDNGGQQYTTISLYNNGTEKAQWYWDQTNTLTVFGTDVGAPIAFKTGTVERMRVQNSGGVSIGTTTDPGVGNLLVNGSVQAASHKTTNFSIQEVSGKLYFYYGSTQIASLDSSGNFTTLGNVSSNGTP